MHACKIAQFAHYETLKNRAEILAQKRPLFKTLAQKCVSSTLDFLKKETKRSEEKIPQGTVKNPWTGNYNSCNFFSRRFMQF